MGDKFLSGGKYFFHILCSLLVEWKLERNIMELRSGVFQIKKCILMNTVESQWKSISMNKVESFGEGVFEWIK